MSVAEKVAELLRLSHAAHAQAKEARRQSALGAADPQARTLLTQARGYRLEAHGLDPSHTAPEWAAEQGKTPVGTDTHTAMLSFYDQQLGPVKATRKKH
jgi:hypothetical protein